GHIPTIAWGGSDGIYGEWTFALTNGSLPEEPCLMANYLAHNGSRTVAAIYEDSYIGREYLTFFKDACRFEGLRVIAEEPISQISTDLSATVGRVRAAGADAIGYFGFGLPAVHINAELAAIGWDPLRVMTTAFLTAPFTPQGMKALKGWAGVDQYDEANPVGQAVIERFAQRHGYRPENFMMSYCYDLANLVAHAISKAHPISAAGVKRGLEKVKMLPAASGGADTFISLAPYVRRGWLGAHYLVVRQATTDDDVTIFGDMGTTLVHRMTARTREQRAATRSGL
ncbi:MAG: ABC transporter substrate-binding protein, partial [Acidimicrobiia bacterium]